MFDYHRQHALEIKVVRIFNTYGPRMHPNDGRVVSNFIIQALKGEDITIYGDGLQTRSFCYVDDLIDGMVRMMRSPADFVGPVNMGNPCEFTMLELAELVLRLSGSQSKMAFRPLPEDDPKQRRPDIALAMSKLGWKPTVSLADGLVPTIDYFRTVLQGTNSKRTKSISIGRRQANAKPYGNASSRSIKQQIPELHASESKIILAEPHTSQLE